MLYCEVERQADVTEALAELGLERRFFRFDDLGVQVVQAMSMGQSLGAHGQASDRRRGMTATEGGPVSAEAGAGDPQLVRVEGT